MQILRHVRLRVTGLLVIAAALQGCDDPACTLTAPLCQIHTVDIEPTLVELTQPGQTATLEIVARDKAGERLNVQAVPVEWVSQDEAIATVAGGAGLTATVTSVANGTTRVYARSVLADTVVRYSDIVVNSAATATHVALRTQPGNAFVGQVLTPQPVVEFRGAGGGLVAVNGTVTASLASGAGVLAGSTTVDVVSGVGTFTNLAITGGSGAHTLRFSAPGLTEVTSTAFTVSTPPVGGVASWFNEDFSSYANNTAFMALQGAWSQNLTNTFSGCSPARSTSVVLDQTSGYGGSGQSMRLNFPSMADCLPNRCDNQGAGRDLFEFTPEFRAKRHLWFEFALRFSADWEVAPPTAWGCGNAPDHKTILLFTNAGDRWEVKVGNFGTVVRVGDPVNGQTLNPNVVHPHLSAPYWDGQWFLVRMEVATGTSNGRFRVWMGRDSTSMTLIHSNLAINIPTREFRTLRMGSNRNTGTAVDTEWWVGRIRIFDTNPGW